MILCIYTYVQRCPLKSLSGSLRYPNHSQSFGKLSWPPQAPAPRARDEQPPSIVDANRVVSTGTHSYLPAPPDGTHRSRHIQRGRMESLSCLVTDAVKAVKRTKGSRDRWGDTYFSISSTRRGQAQERKDISPGGVKTKPFRRTASFDDVSTVSTMKSARSLPSAGSLPIMKNEGIPRLSVDKAGPNQSSHTLKQPMGSRPVDLLSPPPPPPSSQWSINEDPLLRNA